MRIDYCPKCKKAGLKHDNPYEKFSLNSERWNPDKKWCPRCKEWVTPVNHEWHREV